MSEVLRSTTFQLEFNGSDGLTGVRTFSKAVSDADATVEALNEKLGKNATVTYNTVRSKKELTAEARMLVTQMERNAKNTERLTQHYAFLASTVGKTAEEIEVLNAVNALGSGASEAQRMAVTKSVQEYQRLRGSVEGAQGSLRNFRGVAQNAGWQLQDTVVQLQMGTSAFTVLSQQGSQFAAAFGPAGAVVGAVIALAGAVGGVLYKSLNSASGAMERLEKINQEYTKYLSVSSAGVTQLSARMEELARYSKLAADAQLELSRLKAIEAQAESVKILKNELKDAGVWRAFYGDEEKLGLQTNRQLVGIISTVNDLQRSVTPRNLESFLESILKIDPSAKGAQEGVGKLKQSLIEQYIELSRGLKILDDTKDGWKGLSKTQTDTIDKITKAFESEYNSLVRQTETTEQEYERRKQALDNYIARTSEQEVKKAEAYQLLEQWKTEELKKEQDKRQAVVDAANQKIINAFNSEYLSLVKQTESIDQEYERRKKTLDNYVGFLGTGNERTKAAYSALDRWKINQERKEFDRIVKSLVKQTDTVEQEYEKQRAIIADSLARNLVSEQEAAAAYSALEEWKTNKFQAEYDKRERIRQRIENAQFRQRRGNDPVGTENDLFIRNITDLNSQLRSLGEEQLTERQRINALIEQEVLRHKDAILDAELQMAQNTVGHVSMVAQSLTSIVDIMSTGVQQVKQQTAEMNNFQKAMFITTQVVAAAMALINGMAMGTTLAKNAALLDFTGMTSASMIAFGTAVGAAQAGAIMGVTIAGAFDNGGDVPAGQFGIVSEYGDELVNGMLVKGPARVTSRKETERLMNSGGKSSVSLKVDIENRIPGAAYKVEQIDESRVRIIAEEVFSRNIDQGVSSVIGNSNSKTSKSMRKHYKTARNL